MSPMMFVSRLLDVFVDAIMPFARRFQPKGRLVVIEDGDDLHFISVERGKATTLCQGSAPDERQAKRIRRAAGGPVELRLAPNRLISRSLQLPAAGRDYLAPIIEHRLERLTPWRPDKVLYGFAVVGEADDGGMAVDFLATSGDIAAHGIERLAALQIVPTSLGSADEPLDKPLRVDLYRGSRDVGRHRLRRLVARAAVVTALVVVPAAAVSSWLALEAEGRLEALQGKLTLKRNVLLAASGDTDAQSRDLQLINAKQPDSAAMVLVDRLAALLPDSTFLRELEIDGEKVRIAGHSADAPALLPILEADEVLSNVQFSAPVTRDDNGRDGFDIVARWDARVRGMVTGDEPSAAPADEFGARIDTGAGEIGDPLPYDPLRTGALQ